MTPPHPRTLLIDLAARRSQDLLALGTSPTWLDFDVTGHPLLCVDDGRSRWLAVC